MKLVITGIGVVSPAGNGVAALWDALAERRGCFVEAPPYESEGLAQPRCGIAPGERSADALLAEATRQALAQAGLVAPSEAGLVVGTSSGGISGPWQHWHQETLAGRQADETPGLRDAPTRALARALALSGPRQTVSIACASGTSVLEVAERWLREERAPVVLAGGVDALSLFVHAGFGGLGALASERPRPFEEGRDGLLLGEAGAMLVVETEASAVARGATVLAELGGTGLAMDAFHLTAPHREGRGAHAAMAEALARAGTSVDAVDLVSVHGTATVFNDAMEAHALSGLFGERPVPAHGIKGSIGHSLGAAGAVEAAVVVEALRRGEGPPPLRADAADCPVEVVAVSGKPRVALSTSSAFGGMNAAVVLAAPGVLDVPARARTDATVVDEVVVTEVPDWREVWPDRPRRFGRMDDYTRLCLWAVEQLHRRQPLDQDTGLVLASRRSCRLADLRYHQRLLELGAANVSRLDFTYTIPGAPVAEASMLFDLRGPVAALVGPASDALETGRSWAGDRCATVIVLAADVDEPGLTGSVRAWRMHG